MNDAPLWLSLPDELTHQKTSPAIGSRSQSPIGGAEFTPWTQEGVEGCETWSLATPRNHPNQAGCAMPARQPGLVGGLHRISPCKYTVEAVSAMTARKLSGDVSPLDLGRSSESPEHECCPGSPPLLLCPEDYHFSGDFEGPCSDSSVSVSSDEDTIKERLTRTLPLKTSKFEFAGRGTSGNTAIDRRRVSSCGSGQGDSTSPPPPWYQKSYTLAAAILAAGSSGMNDIKKKGIEEEREALAVAGKPTVTGAGQSTRSQAAAPTIAALPTPLRSPRRSRVAPRPMYAGNEASRG